MQLYYIPAWLVGVEHILGQAGTHFIQAFPGLGHLTPFTFSRSESKVGQRARAKPEACAEDIRSAQAVYELSALS